MPQTPKLFINSYITDTYVPDTIKPNKMQTVTSDTTIANADILSLVKKYCIFPTVEVVSPIAKASIASFEVNFKGYTQLLHTDIQYFLWDYSNHMHIAKMYSSHTCYIAVQFFSSVT